MHAGEFARIGTHSGAHAVFIIISPARLVQQLHGALLVKLLRVVLAPIRPGAGDQRRIGARDHAVVYVIYNIVQIQHIADGLAHAHILKLIGAVVHHQRFQLRGAVINIIGSNACAVLGGGDSAGQDCVHIAVLIA